MTLFEYIAVPLSVVMGRETKLVNQLTDAGSLSNYPKWSPSGSHILFQSTRAIGTADASDSRGLSSWFDIYVMEADGSEVQRLTTNELFDAHPNW